jgi:signal-transduction protein with cAMP-binding, CBS, and nucleotidyltransferase domain
VDDAGQVLGIVTDRDMLIALGTRNQPAAELTVADVMTTPAITCHPLDTMESALTLMNMQQVRRLPVVDSGGKLIGMLTMNDIVLHAERKGAREHAVPYDRVMSALKGICGHTQTARTYFA